MKEEKKLRELINKVTYNPDLFKIFIGENKYIMGCLEPHQEANKFFLYKTLYDTLVSLDKNIKKSFDRALKYEYNNTDIDKFSPVKKPTPGEEEAIYYTENAVFRLSALWDLLAQFYNVKFNNNKDPEKVNYYTLFHNDAQGKRPNQFAKKIYKYISKEENEESQCEGDGLWKGNHEYVRNYRNKMTHRNSPNVATISNYAFEMRMPMRYVLKRVIEDYVRVSEFISEMLNIVTAED